MIFCLPSTLVLSRRKMYWKFVFSPDTSAVDRKVDKLALVFRNRATDAKNSGI